MNSSDHILHMMSDIDRILAPLRDFDRLSGRGAQQIAQHFIRQEQMFRAALPDLSSSYRTAIECLQPALDHFRQFERHSSAMASLAEAHRSISAVVTKQQLDLESIARTSVALSPHWQDSMAAFQRLGADVAAGQLALRAHYTSVAESAITAQERLLRIPWESLGSATTIANVEFAGVRDHFTVLAERYRSLMQSFGTHEHFMASFPPLISAGPPLEILASVNVLATLSRTPEVSDTDLEFEDEHASTLEELLAALDPALPSVWAGAKEALRSENPDRVRHVAISLRELVTHVFDRLAPPAAVRGWTSDPSHFHDGRPTREARVLFACRTVNHGDFSRFVSADVRATVEFIDLFHRGTHELAAAFTAAQLRALVARAESLLRFLLLVSRM